MNIKQRYQKVLSNIIDAKSQFNRENDEISLLAVSKNHSSESIQALHKLGHTDFGESYLQEALDKQQALQNLNICWHFIGPIQSNKTNLISQHFDWVHSLCREKIARRLSEARQNHKNPLNVLVQININEEANKDGIKIDDTYEFSQLVRTLPNLKLRGLMAIPQRTNIFEEQKQNFSLLNQLYLKHQVEFQWDTLSIGMSNDYKAAISEGCTLLRIGSKIFGPRQK